MSLYIIGSSRTKNSAQIVKDLSNENDKIISLTKKHINYCLGCNKCAEKLEKYCIQNDNMLEIYNALLANDKIILVSPIYMNQITAILKNVIDRLNPFSNHELLKGKSIYLITVGQMSSEENKEVNDAIIKYFASISEFFLFNFAFLGYFSSGDINEYDDVTKYDENYAEQINYIKEKLYD